MADYTSSCPSIAPITVVVSAPMAHSSSSDQPFEEALASARRGDVSGLTVIFREFQPRLLRYLRAREPSLADDIASETWLAVAQRIRAFDGDGAAFAAWLFTIAKQRLADSRRTTSRRRTDACADVPQADTGATTENFALEHLSAQEAVDFVVHNLNDNQAEVVLLRCLGDLSLAQVAEMMDRDVNWVRVTQHRALKRLAQRINPNVVVTK